MPDTDKILVFIPAYNCAPQIVRVLGQFKGTIAGLVSEVLVLDNGSKDGTAEAAIEHARNAAVARVVVARNLANYNLGGSHKSAFAYAEAQGFTHVITLHGDDQGDINDIVPVLQRGTHRAFDACMGARFTTRPRLRGYSGVRIAGNYVFNLIFSMVTGRWVTDLGSGLNLMARKAFVDPSIKRLPDDLFFNPYLLLDMYARRNKVTFFPIGWREDDQVSNVKMVSQALKTLDAARKYFVSRPRFMTEDLRSVKHETYAFQPTAIFENGVRTL